MVSCNPLPGIYGAVTRKVEENIKGSITSGKLAHLAVFKRKPAGNNSGKTKRSKSNTHNS